MSLKERGGERERERGGEREGRERERGGERGGGERGGERERGERERGERRKKWSLHVHISEENEEICNTGRFEWKGLN